MSEVVNKVLVTVDKYIPEMSLKQLGFTYSTCGPFAKNKETIEKFIRQEIQILLTEASLIKPVFNMIFLMVNQKI